MRKEPVFLLFAALASAPLPAIAAVTTLHSSATVPANGTVLTLDANGHDRVRLVVTAVPPGSGTTYDLVPECASDSAGPFEPIDKKNPIRVDGAYPIDTQGCVAFRARLRTIGTVSLTVTASVYQATESADLSTAEGLLGTIASSSTSTAASTAGLLTNTQLRAEPVSVFAEPPEAQAARTGYWNGKPAEMVYVLGRRSLGWSSMAILGDVADYINTTQALVNTPSSATTLYLVSTNVADDGNPAGTGAQTVRIHYLDAASNHQITTATLDGTTAVSLGDGFSYILWMEVASVGTSTTTVGNVTISSTNGAATVATTFEQVTAGGNRSMSARYKVPTGHTAYLLEWDGFAISSAMDARIRSTVFADNRALSTVFHFQDNMYLASGGNSSKDMRYLRFPAGAEIKVSAIPANAPAGNRFDTSFGMLLVAD